jgi:hypothetical protein
MTLTVEPSTTHSNSVLGLIWRFFRTSDGTETCPRFVTLVRTGRHSTRQIDGTPVILSSAVER